MEISVREAAQRLGVGGSRVRQLLASGDLEARRLGRVWLVNADDVARLQQHGRLSGRPLGARRAWALLDILAGGAAPWLASAARSQLKASLGRLADADANRWRASLRGRSELVSCRIHPAARGRLLGRDDVLPTGLAAIARRPFDLTVGPVDVDQVYVAPDRWPHIAQELAIQTNPTAPNLTVRLPKIPWPFGSHEWLPDSVLAADLLDSPEPRVIEAGAQRLRELVQGVRT